MESEQRACEMACEAFQALVDQCFSNLKQGTPALDELQKASAKYQTAMEQANSAASAFVDALSKVAVTAARARGATSELGQSFQKLITRHHAIINDREAQTRKFSEQFIVPLHKRLKSDNKNFPKLEEDIKTNAKAYRSDLKKAGQNTIKMQKAAQKNKKDPSAEGQIQRALESLMHKSLSLEAFWQRSMRSVMLQERRRYCYLVDNYISVFHSDFAQDELSATAMNETLLLANLPEELPPSSEAVIEKNGSRGLMYEPPSADHESRTAVVDTPRQMRPSMITQEVQRKVSAVPPGAPMTGLQYEPTEDQINPKSRRFTPKS